MYIIFEDGRNLAAEQVAVGELFDSNYDRDFEQANKLLLDGKIDPLIPTLDDIRSASMAKNKLLLLAWHIHTKDLDRTGYGFALGLALGDYYEIVFG